MPLPEIRAALPLAVALLLTGCGSAAPNKVAVDTLYTNVVFGNPTPTPAPPAPAAAPQPPAAATPPEIAPFPTFAEIPPLPGEEISLNPLPAPAAAACPTAPATSFPADPATADVSRKPQPGRYRWALSGKYDISVLGTTITSQLPSFQQRTVSRSTDISDSFSTLPTSQPGVDFTYQTTEPRIAAGGSYLVTWKVKSSTSPTAQADPEGGVSISEVDAVDAAGHSTDILFKPNTGLLVLPLPVTPGQNFQSAALDTTPHANSMALNATVGTQKERVDACGTPLYAWPIDATLASAGGATTTMHFDVATQMGGLVIAENIDGTWLGTTFHGARFHIGQTQPDAAP